MKKLSTEEVYEIKKALKNGEPQKSIAERFKVSGATITSIKQGRTYSYIIVPSEEYLRGWKDGYKQGCKDTIRRS